MSEITEALDAAYAAGKGRAVACAVARLTLPVWEAEQPDDMSLRGALATAEKSHAAEWQIYTSINVAFAAALRSDGPEEAAALAVLCALMPTHSPRDLAKAAVIAGLSPEAILDAIKEATHGVHN